MSTTEHHYISRVHLKGYKSIIDTEVTLRRGLNILIGENGSGKTNFLEFLGSVLKLSYRHLSTDNFSSSIEISKKEIWDLEFDDFNYNDEINDFETTIKEWRRLVGEDKKGHVTMTMSGNSGTLIGSTENSINLIRTISPITSIIYNVPLKFLAFDENMSLRFKKSNYLLTSFPKTRSQFLINFIFESVKKGDFKELFSNNKKDINDYFIFNEKVSSNLKTYSIIKDVRIKEGLSITENENTFDLHFLMFEFLVNDKWLLWKQLSDGTKRMFYLISEVASVDKGTILLEEPELGTHPDQLHKIMTFLKEQSKEKQIIMTTHAPQTLNILEEDELDRIIITKYDSQTGTKMHHLSPEKIEKAQAYMEEAGLWLSDYWVHADLESQEI